MIKLAFILQTFSPVNQIQFLEKYCKEFIQISKKGYLLLFAKQLLSLCSQNFSDKDGEFTGIPLQTMMLGEVFVKEAEEYCSSGKVNLPEKFNLLSLFRKFTEKKFNIYFSEKNEMNSSKPEVKKAEKTYLEKHTILTLISLFPLNKLKSIMETRKDGDMEQAVESGVGHRH